MGVHPASLCLLLLLCTTVFCSIAYDGGIYHYPANNGVRVPGSYVSAVNLNTITECTREGLMLLSTSTTSCLNYFNSSLQVKSTKCPTGIAGSTSVKCITDYCFYLNPTSSSLIVEVKASGAVNTYNLNTLSSGAVTKPVVFEVGFYFGFGPLSVYVIDDANHNVYLVEVDTTSNTATVTEKFTLDVTSTPVGVFMPSFGPLMIAFENGVNILSYEASPFFPGVQIGSPLLLPTFMPATFGNTSAFAGDNYNRLYVADASCNCVQILLWDFTGVVHVAVIDDITTSTRAISVSLDRVYLTDAAGVVQYTHVSEIYYNVTNSTCGSEGGTFSVNVIGGAVTNVEVIPESGTLDQSTFKYYTSMTFPKVMKPVKGSETVIFDDSFNNVAYFKLNGGNSKNEAKFVNSTVITPVSGNLSLSVVLSFLNFLTIGNTQNVMNNKVFKTLEFWIHPGLGGQTITIAPSLLASQYDLKFLPGDLKPEWRKITFDLWRLSFTPTLVITNNAAFGSPLPNPFYIDNLRLIPYTTQRSLHVFDVCGDNDKLIPMPDIDYSREFKVEIAPTPVTCNAIGINYNTSRDGKAIATPVNGAANYTYAWNYAGVESNITSISSLVSGQSFIDIYKNSVVQPWIDVSGADGAVMNDTTQFRSAPYSFSFAPKQLNTLFSFQTPVAISSTLYSGIEFYVNGGEMGGQMLSVLLTRFTDIVQDKKPFSELMGGIPIIPPNTWTRVFVPLVGTGVPFVFDKISIISTLDPVDLKINIKRVYFDDMVILSKPVLSVTDGNSCTVTVDRLLIDTPTPLVSTIKVENLQCFGDESGSFDLDIMGGVAPYDYKWSASRPIPLSAIEDIAPNLNESIIDINVTDSHGCILPPIHVAVLQPPKVELQLKVEQSKCKGQRTSIAATAIGGMGSYTYTWASTASSFFLVPQAAPVPLFTDTLAAKTSLVNASVQCLGTGTAYGATISPSRSGYCSIKPTAGAMSFSIVTCDTCIPNNTYTGMRFSVLANKSEVLLEVSFRSQYTQKLYSTKVSAGWNEISINFTSDLTDPYEINFKTYDIVAGSLSALDILVDDVVLVPKDANNVGTSVHAGYTSNVAGYEGTYFLSIVDSNGCAGTYQFNVTDPVGMTVSSDITLASTKTATDGSLEVTVTGGTAPYTYLWVELNSTSKSISNLAYGTYTLKVTDANGCEHESSIFVDFSKVLKVRAFNKGLSGGLGAITGVGAIVAIFATAMLAIHWALFSSLGSFFSAMLLLGVFVSYAAALVVLPRPTDALCTAYPWLLGIAFVLVYGCLFIKTWALYQVWSKAKQYQKSTLTPWRILRLLVVLLVVEIAFLIIWTVVDPPKVRRVEVTDDTLELQCDSDHPTFWIIFLSVKGVWLVFGAVLSVLTRDLVKKYNESTSIAYAIYNITVLCCIGVPLGILMKTVPGGRKVIMVVIPVLAFTFTMCIMFFRYWYTAFTGSQTLYPTGSAKTSTGSGSPSGSNTHSSSRTPTPPHSKSSAASGTESHSVSVSN